MKRITYYVLSLSLLIGCAAENSKPSNTDNTYDHVDKVKTNKCNQLDKVIINSPPTPPEGFERPVVKPDITDKN